MAVMATVKTQFGEDRAVYIRLNNIEASNHGFPATALFRAYISKEAFAAGAQYVWEHQVTWNADVSQPLWSQAYLALISEQGFRSEEI